MRRPPLAVLVHELRSPVATLTAIAESYRTSDEPTRQRLRELAAAAVAAVERLLADPLLASFHPERVDAGELALAAVEAARLGGATVVASAEVGITLEGDPAGLRQAVDNLIANAVGHSPEGTPVAVSVAHRGASVVISVTDQGEGIAAADQARVFESGVRLTSARPGSGLGLAIVQSVARAHGGEVELESAPGRGATFRLVLPDGSGAG